MKKILILIYSLPFVVSAQSGNMGSSNCPSGQLCNPLNGINDLPTLISTILNKIVEPLAAVAVVVMIIYSGFKFLTAQGNATEIAKARTSLLWVLIGAGILLGAAAIAAAVQGTFSQLFKP